MQDQPNPTTQIATPSNYYGPTGQPSSKNNKHKPALIISVIIAVCLIIIGIAVAIVALNNNSSETEEQGVDPAIVALRQNSPTLEFYATLKEEMPLSELQNAVAKADIGAEIFVTSGNGTISIPGETDLIYFYIDEATDSDGAEENEDIEPYYTSEEVNEIDKYKPTDIVYYIRYAREINEEEGIGISYVDEGNEYEVYDGYEFFNFPTKEEAIEAYLSQNNK